MLRTTASLSARGAIFGRCSPKRTPGTRVGMVLKTPRTSAGASGLGSHMSIWLCPPPANRIRTERARGGAANARPRPSSPRESQERRVIRRSMKVIVADRGGVVNRRGEGKKRRNRKAAKAAKIRREKPGSLLTRFADLRFPALAPFVSGRKGGVGGC